ncbi:hypothetical protein PMAYCL1PPCAC_14561, partial [Pristionchus mayeri]
GWLAPALLPVRRFVQKIIDLPWDESLSADLQQEWNSIADELADRELIIPRRIPGSQAELHAFRSPTRVVGRGGRSQARQLREEGDRRFSTHRRMQTTAAFVLRFARRTTMTQGIPVHSEYLQPHPQESESRILTAQERSTADRWLIAEATKEYSPHPEIVRKFGLEKDGETWRACTAETTAEETLNTYALPRHDRYWFKTDLGRLVVEANEMVTEIQATLRRWKLNPVADLETCSLHKEEKVRLRADLALVTILGRSPLENARQSIPVLVKNVVDIAVMSPQSALIFLFTLVIIVYVVSIVRTKAKAD